MEHVYYTIEEVAERLKVSRPAIYKWMTSGQLPYVIVGSHRRITGDALRAFVRPGRPDDAPLEDASSVVQSPPSPA